MKTLVNFFVMALVAALSMVATSCGTSLVDEEGLDIPSKDVMPRGFLAISDGYIKDGEFVVNLEIPFSNSEKKDMVQGRFSLEAIAEKQAKGSEPWYCTDSDIHDANLENNEEQAEFAYNYGTNTVKAGGLVLKYEYNGEVYELYSLAPITITCRMSEVLEEEVNPSYYAKTRADYTLKSNDHVLATAATTMIASEDYIAPDFDKVEWNYTHKAFNRNATLSNGVINVLCNNVANFADLYTDGSKQNEEAVDYTVSNKFNFSAPAMEVNTLGDVVGKTFNFNNGTATVATYSVKATWASATVEGKVMHGDKDYASEITACKAAAKTITFNSATEAVVRFYDNDANDYAEVTVPVKVSEKVTLKSIIRNFAHKAFRKNATVSGKNIAVTCDNEASFVKEYSDGHKDAAVKVNYTVVNNFSFNAPAMVVENLSSVLNKTYNFNNGAAVVAGKNVTVTFSNRVIADIMFEGKNYKNEAPKCAAEVKTITITSATTATITFEGEGETITAVVPVSIVEAESINGEIKAAWGTDSYNGRTFVRTDLHVLAELNGAYVVYSRQNRNEAWTITNLSAAEGQSVLASGRALAWIWNGNNRYMGTVAAQESASAGYTIQYYLLDGQLANNLGKSESTLNGKKFENPVHGTGKFSNGMWTIAYNGSTYYFVSNN